MAGVAHVCPIAATAITAAANETNNLKAFLWKLSGGLMLALVLQLGGAIWWASRVQATIDNFKDQIQKQQQTIERIDGYFRRPLPP